MARYRKFDLRTWSDEKFRSLTPLPPSGQSLWFFFLLGPQTTSIPGLFEASDVVLAHRLRWPMKAFREAFREVSAKGMAEADWEAGLVWLPNAPRYNKPESPNVIRSWGSIFDELPECELKREAYQALKAFAEGWGEGFAEAFRQALREPSGKAMANQEQEQEQEQKQKPNPVRLRAPGGGGCGTDPLAKAVSQGDLLNASGDPVATTEPESQTRGAVERVFAHWQKLYDHPKAVLDAKRRKIITNALASYSEADLRRSIEGYQSSPHHMGQNERATVYDDVELFLRDARHIEMGLKFATAQPQPGVSALTRKNLAAAQEFMRRVEGRR